MAPLGHSGLLTQGGVEGALASDSVGAANRAERGLGMEQREVQGSVVV